MKELKKQHLPSVFLLILLIFSTPILSHAALPDRERECSITIQKYEVEDVNDYGTAGNGEAQEITGLPTISNIDFTVTRVQDDATSPADAVPLTGNDEYSLTLPTDDKGTAYFGALAQGVYLIHEEPSSAVHTPVEDFLVSLPMTNTAGNAWLYDVFVYPKNKLNEIPTIDMYVYERFNKTLAVNIGDVINWFAASDIPHDIADAALFQVTVTLDDQLTLDENTVQVYVLEDEATNHPLEAATDYILKIEGQQLTVELSKAGQAKISDLFTADNVLTLIVDYKVPFMLNEATLPEGLNELISCDAVLNYTSSLNKTHVINSLDPASVYSGGFRILKTDSTTDTPLEGAVFLVYANIGDAAAGTNALQNPYLGGNWQIVTDANGEASVYGLAYGKPGDEIYDANQDYYLVEIQAPADYNLLKSPVTVPVDISSLEPDSVVLVANNRGFTLPVTGGMGIFLFIVVGTVLLSTAILLFKKANPRRDS